MQSFVTVVHVITCTLLVLVVLIQSGKGAEISASFGGSSQTVFGSSGGANFFTRFTAAMATIFMITSLTLTIMGGQSRKSIFESAPVTESAPITNPEAAKQQEQPAPAPAPAPAK
ncbi:MAG: preprotein translocase subunit SecG [Bdellovibrionales bacterium GWB1_55_8]|nr:MAG: preprotein translocase subunit SecG [Bdellovibrionales bacterium GWB1_55_8]